MKSSLMFGVVQAAQYHLHQNWQSQDQSDDVKENHEAIFQARYHHQFIIFFYMHPLFMPKKSVY